MNEDLQIGDNLKLIFQIYDYLVEFSKFCKTFS